jgi:hypothetical protein
MDIRTGVRNWPAALQYAITVTCSPFSPDIKTRTLLDPFPVITEAGCHFIHVENISIFCQKVYFVTNFSIVLKNVSTFFRSIP